ncbi:MAG: peptidase M50 [Oscillospiraceae bacterium]|nr:peptidase M50 [Oscillospiraceae bacterium]
MRLGRITVTGGFFVMAALFTLFDRNGFVPFVILAALVHELGHFIAIYAMGGRVLRLHLGLVGLRIDYEGRRIGYLGEVIIALAGPFVNLAFAYGVSLLGQHMGGEAAFFLAGINFGAALFNLLPIYQLDGGRALYCILALVTDSERAGRVLCVTSCVAIFALLVAGAFLFLWSAWNFTLLAAAIWLLVSYCKNGGNAVKYAVTEY